MKETYPTDSRFAGKRGRYTSVVYATNDASADGTILAPGDGNRVAIIAIGKFPGGAAGASVVLGPLSGGVVVPVLAPNLDSPVDRACLEEYGDVVMGPIYRANVGAGGTITLIGVIWMPDGV